MRTSISKKLLAGALSVMMVLSLFAGVPANKAQAASKYSITKKASITAEKTNTYTIKGVKKAQYVKMTYKNYKGIAVKYNGETVTKSLKINGGKNIKLKVTAPDKVAKYNAKVTFKVYNKGTKKVVKTLKINSAVKVTELKVSSVEAATFEASGNIKYLLVQFNKALDSLDKSEVSIRRDRDGQLYTVSNVDLAKDGKSATITLLGNDNAGTTGYLESLEDYTLKVTKQSVTASLGFNIPRFGTGTVTAFDATNNTITIGGIKLYAEGLNLDYFDLLGKTVDVKYDVDQKLVKLTDISKKTVYSSFATASKANADGSIAVSDYADANASYTTQPATVGNNTKTAVYTYDATSTRVVAAGDAVVNKDYLYAKITLNPNGTIKTIVALPTAGGVWAIVKEVSGTYINGYDTTSINVKGFTVLKDNKVVDLATVAKDDVVFVNSTLKTVVIYNSVEEAEITSVYTDKVVFGTEVVKYTDGVYSYGIDEMGTEVVMDNKFQTIATPANKEAVFSKLKAGGKVKLAYTFDGLIRFVVGTAGEVKTNVKAYVVTTPFGAYELKNEGYIYGKLSDGKDTLSIDIPVDQLNAVVDNSKNITKDTSADVYTVTGDATQAEIKKNGSSSDKFDIAAWGKGTIVYVTTNAKGDVVGLSRAYTPVTIQDDADLSKNPALGGLVTSGATPLFEVNFAKGKITAVTTLGEYKQIMSNSLANSYVVPDSTNPRVAAFIVIDTAELANSTEIAKKELVVIRDLDTFTNANGVEEIKNLSAVVNGSEEVTVYTKFVDATDATLIATLKHQYAVVELGFDANGNILEAANGGAVVVSGADLNASVGQETATTLELNSTAYQYYSDADYTSKIYSVQANGSLKLISWSDLRANKDYIDHIVVANYKGISPIIGTVVVEFGSTNHAAAREANAAIADDCLAVKTALLAATTGALPYAAGASVTGANGCTIAVEEATDADGILAGNTVTVAGNADKVAKITVTVSKTSGTTKTGEFIITVNSGGTAYTVTMDGSWT